MRKKTTKKNLLTAPLALALLLTAVGLVGVSAKYVAQATKTPSVESGAFYFTSDLLTEEGAAYTLNEDADAVQFELRNWADELRWADMAIDYTVEVSPTATVSAGTGELESGESGGTTDTVTVSGLRVGTYTVTARANTPYVKTLTATFTVPEAKSDLHYEVSDSANSPYAILTVWTDDYSGNAAVSWAAGLVPDATQDDFASVKTYGGASYAAGSVVVRVSPYSSYTFRFLKTDPTQNYTDADIKAVRG